MPDFLSGNGKDFFATQLDNIPSTEMPTVTFIVDGNDKRGITAITNEKFDSNSMYYYQSHKAELMELFDSLADETSKRALYHYVETYVTNCVYKD